MADIDLLIDGERFDLVLDVAGEPVLVDGRETIAQDARDMILDNYYAVDMIGQRSRIERANARNNIALALEEDVRIKPGTAAITETSLGTLQVVADTIEYGPIGLDVEVQV